MSSRTTIAVVVVVIIAIATAVAVGSVKKGSVSMSTMPSTAPSAPTSSQQPDSVTIKGYAFGPAKLTVKKGTTVTWTNEDIAGHTITTDTTNPAGGPSSSLVPKGGNYKFTFNTVGVYTYHCEPHPYMKASVTVTE